MLQKRQLDELTKFLAKQGEALCITRAMIEKITVETAANLRLTFPSHTSQLELIRRVTKQVLDFSGAFSENDQEDIGLAIDEACTNVIAHSYRVNGKGVIQVEFNMQPDKITIILTDMGEEGSLFNPDILSDLDREKYFTRLRKGGLGVHLIKKIMDVVEYTVSPGVKNCLTMVKYVQPARAG